MFWNKPSDGVIACAYRQAHALKVIMMVEKMVNYFSDKIITLQLQTHQ